MSNSTKKDAANNNTHPKKTDAELEQSFTRGLCMGEIAEDIVFPFPVMKADEVETLHSLIESLEGFLGDKEEKFAEWDAAGEYPPEFIEELKAYGLFSLIVPEAHDGLGLSNTAYSRALQELATYDGALAVTIGAHSSIGMRGLWLFGTEAQQKKYGAKLASGEMIAAFCLTESGAGSDAAALSTKAERVNGKWILNGEKLWISNGGIADFFTVFAKTEGEKGKVTAFIVTRDLGGVSHGPHEDKMGIRACSTTTVAFDNVELTDEHVLGEVGGGFKVAMNILNSGRSGLGGGTIGMMKKMIKLCTKQAKERKQFGRPIAEFGLIKQKIGHMVVECYATESVVSMVAGLSDQGYKDYAVEAAISKVFGTEAAWRTIDEGLQIAAGNGYMKEFPYERMMRDARINRIFEGTNEILRLFIALTAINDAGRELKSVAKTLSRGLEGPIKGFGVLSDYARKRMVYATGLGGATFSRAHESLRPHTRMFEMAAKELAAAVDRLLRKHGKGIIGKQFATKRLADIMIDLFVLSCVISRVSSAIENHGEEKSKEEIQILEVFAGQVHRRVNGNFRKIDNNNDELIKSLADHALEHERFVWDNI